MSDCEFRKGCLFFRNQMDNLPGTAGLYRQQYCHGRRHQCARHMVQRELGGAAVPKDLLPYHHDRACCLLDHARRLTRPAI